MSERRVAVFDGDDTLWWTEPLYDAARARAAEVVSRLGLDADLWDEMQRRKDVENVDLYGYNAERFPLSCVQALDWVASQQDIAIDDRARSSVRRAAMTVFTSQAVPVPSARRVLETVRRSYHRVLLTAGDAQVQYSRVEQAGLTDHLDSIEVVTSKSEATFRRLLLSSGNGAEGSWSIGNNLAADVIPAVQLGAGGVWIDARVWEYERRRMQLVEAGPRDRLVTAAALDEVPEILGAA